MLKQISQQPLMRLHQRLYGIECCGRAKLPENALGHAYQPANLKLLDSCQHYVHG